MVVFILIYTSPIHLFCFSITENERICECGLEKDKHKPCIEGSGTFWTMEHNTIENINPVHQSPAG